MPSSCKDIRKSILPAFTQECTSRTNTRNTGEALAQCLLESDCVMVHRNSPADCLRPPLLDTMPTKCQQIKRGYGECKRGMVDMRKRFRGNQPISVAKEGEPGSRTPKQQLYAGKSAFGGAVRETSGDEPEKKDWREVENEKYRKGL